MTRKKVNKYKIGQQLSNGVFQCSSHTITCFASLRDTSRQFHQHQILRFFLESGFKATGAGSALRPLTIFLAATSPEWSAGRETTKSGEGAPTPAERRCAQSGRPAAAPLAECRARKVRVRWWQGAQLSGWPVVAGAAAGRALPTAF